MFKHFACPFNLILLDVVLGKQIGMVGHGFEFEVVSRRILEKHGILFPRHAFKSQSGLNHEFDTVRTQSIGEVVKLLDGFQRQSGVWNRNLISIHWVIVINAAIIVSRPVTDDLVPVERVILPFFGGTSLFATQNSPIKFLGFFKRVNRKGVVKWIAWGGAASCLVLRCAAGGGVIGRCNGRRIERGGNPGSCRGCS